MLLDFVGFNVAAFFLGVLAMFGVIKVRHHRTCDLLGRRARPRWPDRPHRGSVHAQMRRLDRRAQARFRRAGSHRHPERGILTRRPADLLLINTIVGIVLPVLVALLTKAAAPDWVKTMVQPPARLRSPAC